MPVKKLFTPQSSNGLFGELYISTNWTNGYTNIGIYDNGHETFDVDELVAIRQHLNNIILKLKFPVENEKKAPF